MGYYEGNGGGMSPADMAAVMGGNRGYGMGGFGDFGFGAGQGWWIILLFLLLGNNGWGNGLGGGGMLPFMMGNNYTNNDIQRGFDQQTLVAGIGNVTNAVQNGFANAEVSRCNSQANILQTLNQNQNATTQGMNQLAMSLQQCCCVDISPRLKAGGDVKNNLQQEVQPNAAIVFTDTIVPCNRGLIEHRDDTGAFLLSPWVPRQNGCQCCRNRQSALYLVDFGANIAVPTGGTVGEISVAIAINGTVIPSSTMIVTPAAVEQFFNVSRAIHVQLLMNCCQTVSVINTSTQPILVQNANIIFSRPDLAVTR